MKTIQTDSKGSVYERINYCKNVVSTLRSGADIATFHLNTPRLQPGDYNHSWPKPFHTLHTKSSERNLYPIPFTNQAGDLQWLL